jgi:hypothetical protein
MNAPHVRDAFSPRSLLVRQTVTVELSAEELHVLISALQAEAEHAAQHFDQVGYADHIFRRVAELREAAR